MSFTITVNIQNASPSDDGSCDSANVFAEFTPTGPTLEEHVAAFRAALRAAFFGEDLVKRVQVVDGKE